MKSKILFVDLDATLLCDDKTISEKNLDAIHRMLDAGHYLVLATGRPIESGRAVAKKMGITTPGFYMLAFNGAVIYDCAADCVLMKKSIPIDIVQELFERAEKAGIYVQTYNNTDIIATRHTRELDCYRERTHLSYKLSRNVLDVLEEEPQKVLLIDLDNKKRLEKFQRDNYLWQQGKCNSFFSSSQYLEYCPLNTDKGTGLEDLRKILNMPQDCTVAMGDEQNDIYMIRAAHVGIAMKNGTKEVLAAADYVTEHDNNHSAVAEVIEKFIL